MSKKWKIKRWGVGWIDPSGKTALVPCECKIGDPLVTPSRHSEDCPVFLAAWRERKRREAKT